MKILGREPALAIGALNALIMLAGTLGFAFLGQDQAGLWVVAVNAASAAVVAWATRPLSPGVFAYLLSSAIALGGAYGLNFTAEFTNGLNMALVPILALLTRGQVSPITTPLTNTTANPTPEAANAELGTPGGLVEEPPEQG